jgi:NAD(P) transhydrogenase subunit alpha
LHGERARQQLQLSGLHDPLVAHEPFSMPDAISATNNAAHGLTVGVATETFPGERRVALVPPSLAALKKTGATVLVQAGAGQAAGFVDAAYLQEGAELVACREEVFARADVLLQVRTAGANADLFAADLPHLRAGQGLIGLCDPLGHPQLLQQVAERGVQCLALELLPRITRAQTMDVLSSQANLAGYKAVLLAAVQAPRVFPLLMTAAGTLTAAKVFVIGAGVAGLQAIATARRLGATVKAYDVRPAVKEEVQSLGAKFVELGVGGAGDAGGYARAMDEDFYRRQREALLPVVADSDVVITTAAVPGRKAPVLVTREMVEHMAPGSVIIDLAAEQGGNCELTVPRQTVDVRGVTIVGCVNLPATIPFHASLTYSRNMTAFLQALVRNGQWNLDRNDELVSATLVTHEGQVVHPRVRELLATPSVEGRPPGSPG